MNKALLEQLSKITDEEKKSMITGALFCTSSGGLADLAESLTLTFSHWPLPFLKGCASVEEMTVRLAVEG